MAKKHERFGRLTPETVREWFPEGTRGIIGRDKVEQWLKQNPSGGRAGIDNRRWSDLKAGKDVPWPLIELLLRCLVAERRSVATIRHIAVETTGHAATEPQSTLPTAYGWNGFKRNLDESYSPPSASFCMSENELRIAANIVMQRIGRAVHGGEESALSHAEAVLLGEQTYGLTRAEYVKWLARLYRKCRLALMFAVHPDPDGTFIREGVSILLPLSQACYEELRDGMRGVFDVRPSDLKWPTRYVFALASTETYTPPGIKKGPKMLNLLKLMQYQHALLAAPASDAPWEFQSALTLVTNSTSERFCTSYGFIFSSDNQPPQAAKIFRLAWQKSGWSIKSRIGVAVMRGLIEMFKVVYLEDRARWNAGVFPPVGLSDE